MANNSNNEFYLPFISINEATDKILSYIDDRRKHIICSLKTRWHKFNNSCMGGIEPNTIYSIGGISGSGKSSFINSLETDLFDLNKNTDFVVLSFNYEMLSSRQIGRKLSYRLKRTVTELYSGTEDTTVTENDFEKVKEAANTLRNYEIYYVDTPGSVEEVYQTARYFQKTVAKGKWLVILLDHTLLVRGNAGDDERKIISDLQKMFMTLKKIGTTTIIQLTQLNRNIESVDRVRNPAMHFPQRSDIFASDSVFFASDYVIIIHRPELLGITTYGTNNWPVENIIYLHIIKNRDGSQKILKFFNNLKYNSIEENENEVVS